MREQVSLIRPPAGARKFHWGNVRVNHITEKMVADAPPFDAVWAGPRGRGRGQRAGVPQRHVRRGRAERLPGALPSAIPACRYVCTVKVARRVWPGLVNHKLDTVSDALGIALDHHEAGSDARAAGLILQAALRETGSADADELAEKIGMRLGRISPMARCRAALPKKQGAQKRPFIPLNEPNKRREQAMKNYLENIDRDALRARAEQMLGYANDARSQASRWTDYAVSKAREFSLFDFAVFEACLLTLGLWLGTCFSKLFKKSPRCVCSCCCSSWLYLLWRIVSTTRRIDPAEGANIRRQLYISPAK